jgi:hypothetical protein
MSKSIDLSNQLDDVLGAPNEKLVGEELDQAQLSRIAGGLMYSGQKYSDQRDMNDAFVDNRPGDFIKATWTKRI